MALVEAKQNQVLEQRKLEELERQAQEVAAREAAERHPRAIEINEREEDGRRRAEAMAHAEAQRRA